MSQILVVDDDPRICRLLQRCLVDENYSVLVAATGQQAREALAQHPIDLVLLDLRLPDEDGISITRHLQTRPEIGIIIVTGRHDVMDKVVCLEMGADDYITKPFHLREVLARIRSVLRRKSSSAQRDLSVSSSPEHPILRFANWQLEFGARRLIDSSGQEHRIASGEFDLLSVFVQNPHRVLSRDQLLDQVTGRSWAPYDRSIDTRVRRLRKVIEISPAKPELIKTVRGVGYVFSASVESVA